MLASRTTAVLARYVASKKCAAAAPLARKYTLNAVPSKIAPTVSVSSTAKLFAVEPVTATSLMRQQEFEITYQNKALLDISFDGIMEDLYKQDEVLECIKRTYQPNWKRRKAKHGFLGRNATANGRKVNKRRAAAGRRISI